MPTGEETPAKLPGGSGVGRAHAPLPPSPVGHGGPTLRAAGAHAGLSPIQRRLLATLLIVILPIVMLAGAWRLGGASAIEDDILYYLPVRQYIGERIRAGEWPLWNPLV